MMKITMMMTMILLSTKMTITNSTKSMIMTFCSFTVISSIMMSMTVKMTIIPFLLVLTILGGISILFMYMTATIKETEKNSNKMKLKTTAMLMAMLMMSTPELVTKTSPKMININLKDNSNMVFKEEGLLMMAMLMMTIMITLLVSVWSCSTVKAPVRQKTNK